MSRVLLASALVIGTVACDETPTSPSGGAIVSFTVQGEGFRVWLSTAEQIAAARAAQAGGSARIPNGRIVSGTQVNTGWSWHLEDVSFADLTIELCDGRPSDVEREGIRYGGGRYCPWGASITSIEER